MTLVMGVAVLSACKDETSELTSSLGECNPYIWCETSQRIVVLRKSGFAAQENEYDYVKDTLPNAAETQLKKIVINNAELHCIADGYEYETTITDQTGASSTYFSGNKACVADPKMLEGKRFIKTDETEEFINLL